MSDQFSGGGGGGSATPSSGGAAQILAAGSGYFISNGYFAPPSSPATGVVSAVANQVRMYYFVLPIAITVRNIVLRVSTASAASTVTTGIYSADGNTLLLSSSFSGTSTATLKNAITSVTLTPQAYWFAIGATDTVVGVDGFGISNIYNNGVPGVLAVGATAGNFGGSATNSLSGGALPATLGAIVGNSSGNSLPAVVFIA